MPLGNQHASVKPRALCVAFASRLIVVALGGLEVCLRVRGSTLRGVWRCEIRVYTTNFDGHVVGINCRRSKVKPTPVAMGRLSSPGSGAFGDMHEDERGDRS